MATSLIHIGFHKTGTTWFQRRYYPSVASHRYIEQRDVITAFGSASLLDLDPKALQAALGIAADRAVILCDETLCGSIREPGMHGRAAWTTAAVLKELLPDAEIVIFVRHQVEALASLYGEFVRGGMTRSAREFVDPAYENRIAPLASARRHRTNLTQLEYDRLIARYEAVFGRDRVHVYTYEAFRTDPAVVLASLAERFGLCVEARPEVAAMENPAYQAWLLPLVRVLNRFGRGTTVDDPVWIDLPGWYALSRSVLHRLNGLRLFGGAPTPLALFGPELTGELERRYQASNRRLLALRPDLPLADLGYPL